MSRLALLSVSDKTGLIELAKSLTEELDFEIVSSGGTAKAISDAGIPVIKVADYTGSPEILGGRVKTLHPKVHGGILARPDQAADQGDLTDNDIRAFDLVVVNLYPFEQTVAQPAVTLTAAIEKIDIGGPTMIRAAAKNHRYVTVLCNPNQYDDYLTVAKANQGRPSQEFRASCAQQAFWHTASYDCAIAQYLTEQQTLVNQPDEAAALPASYAINGHLKQTLRYGENPHQSAGWYQSGAIASGWAAAKQLQGKALSYNNLVDLEGARRIIAEFPNDERPAAAVLKHTNPCGVAIADSLSKAYQQAFDADNVSAFGGIVALNQSIDAETAQALTGTFLECVVAPACSEEAKAILASKKNLRILLLPDLVTGPRQTVRAIAGGFLTQASDDLTANPTQWTIVTQKKPSEAELAELLFSWRVVKHVKSNAILITRDRTTLGVGAGQMNRVGAVKIALEQAGKQSEGAILASDGFFPFDDSVRTAAAAGIKAIVQPGGSIRDEASITAADELGLVMAFTGTRHFLH
ncbi:bifunctional phosphoribosylaminoimidazolecarboxamide formyltransferase/IMP cyclohydrolase [cf. Phormidesmis sp. LEGE 11477]|uniref:bifunctional phosphoribosylaminoimidazolecarboxamide formyltransferase/IMP cyclohydrolase n=1 Tax=cf. Phormidesmis sp. LEGE 11477 TaxID=1828680 RepID=UPI001880EA07|nr:bifunctional phosphoribosylaminoimidazolecarboxamide formyltransferase/IMP cyclohydrolase [cf. Phormidesmis sp. LEGE 11477]MBE9059997.1 bifunctional phosphoribosylaminoimidazolecarboxamide formyltransferase/IMP cyclohydrolase [cf. Phormidesmis sp. LEGE 11477]